MNTNTNRYEVIADYPLGTWGIGTILIPSEDGEMYSKEHGYSPSDRRIFLKDIGKYPHLFRLLKWWEHVPIDELPKYIKSGTTKAVAKVEYKEINGVLHAKNVLSDNWHNVKGYSDGTIIATEAEYNEYFNKINSK